MLSNTSATVLCLRRRRRSSAPSSPSSSCRSPRPSSPPFSSSSLLSHQPHVALFTRRIVRPTLTVIPAPTYTVCLTASLTKYSTPPFLLFHDKQWISANFSESNALNIVCKFMRQNIEKRGKRNFQEFCSQIWLDFAKPVVRTVVRSQSYLRRNF